MKLPMGQDALFFPLMLYLVLTYSFVVFMGSCEEEKESEETFTSVMGVIGNRAALPCNITPPAEEDAVALILWYKDDITKPIYSVDARKTSVEQARHVAGEAVSTRVALSLDDNPSILYLESLSEEDEGEYRCRVDFRRARSRNAIVFLQLVVPPKKPIITDQNGEILESLIGPYNEGDHLNLICEAEEGKPLPSVTWWRETVLLDDTYVVTPHGVVRNELEVPSLQRHDLMAVFTCQASNNNFSIPAYAAVTVDMNFRPVSVKLEGGRRPMSAEKPVRLVCKSAGSKPPAVISWWMGTTRLKHNKDTVSSDGNTTTSVLNFRPTMDDNGKQLTCRAENPLIAGSALDDIWDLEIYYVPQLVLRLGSKLRHYHIQEGNDVYLECDIRANPWVVEIGWSFEGRELHTNVSAGVIISNQSLVLQRVQRSNRGHYTCTASNVEGTGESKPLYLSVQCPPDAVQNCTVMNRTQNSFRVECVEGSNGGLRQFFVMELHDTLLHRLRDNQTADIPVFLARDLPSATSFVVVIYAVNAKGKSQAVVLRANTLDSRQKHLRKAGRNLVKMLSSCYDVVILPGRDLAQKQEISFCNKKKIKIVCFSECVCSNFGQLYKRSALCLSLQ